MEMNSKVVPSLGHCFANLFLHGITKQPVHCIGLFLVVCTKDISACVSQRMARLLVLRGDGDVVLSLIR